MTATTQLSIPTIISQGCCQLDPGPWILAQCFLHQGYPQQLAQSHQPCEMLLPLRMLLCCCCVQYNLWLSAAYVPILEQITMDDVDGQLTNTTEAGIVILAEGQQVSMNASAADVSNTTLEYNYVLVPADEAAKLDMWTPDGVEKAPEAPSPANSEHTSNSSAVNVEIVPQKGTKGGSGMVVRVKEQALPTRAAPVADASLKPMSGGCSVKSNVSYTVKAADECMVPVIAIRNGDPVSLLGGSGALGDTAVALPMQTHCSRQTAFTTRAKNGAGTGNQGLSSLAWALLAVAAWHVGW